MEDYEKLYAKLIEEIKLYNPNSNFDLIDKAYKVALEGHMEQKRASGEPYIVHCIEVARIIASLELNSKSIAAAMLHDVIEDTRFTAKDIKEMFGNEIALIVEGVSKLTNIPLHSQKEQQMENIRNMFMAMSKDIRVIIVKLADRLHNMRTLEYKTRKSQIEKSKETLDIYAPIAHRLGMSSFRTELEDLAFMHLYPEEYADLTMKMERDKEQRFNMIDSIKGDLESDLKNSNIEGHVEGRVKHLYSIYRKMISQNKSLDQIYDIFALRIIVNNVKDCYFALGMLHENYKPIPGRFKDYIAMPKKNMYQSLHTTLINKNGRPFEVQIRTWEMHRVAEFGIAAHWKYKQKIDDAEQSSSLEWISQWMEWQKETRDEDEFYSNLKNELFDMEVFVFTPKGDVINLPQGSNTMDFAYSVHSAIGNKMVGAKVNGKMVPITYVLQTGDIVEIITSNTSKGPSRDWLKLVKTSQARTKIKQFFRKERKEENIEKGKEQLYKEIRRQGLNPSELLKPQYYEKVLERYNFPELEDVMCAIGYGGITSNKVISRLKEEYKRHNKEEPKLEIPEVPEIVKTYKSTEGIIVRDIPNCLLRISKCCNPVPGDDIVGYITRGRGVSVHRADCINIINDEEFAERKIDVYWNMDSDDKYETRLEIKAYDRANLVTDIMKLLSEQKIQCNGIKARIATDGYANIHIIVMIRNKDEIAELNRKLRKINGIYEINRFSKRQKIR
ncbi:MAG TPA: bifunctional (p)ppGpp synthetase/guanosine-3',5'-bis(diphosphate) 3'-pyrophosphohydrolase [Clostridia bacterium]|jgi:GTP pyrophosphokinase|nr:bifunctional (p)ppGpp synthetase/guanosine-3',5'-bis(diphosphate) 3'-pyrophosphohydrolase [Clostridiaceae bacterium]HOF25842.1 bifunctional (p)ppGpp synthetase/guanosine-3',5'-bis(diphosphate) 3'-pyrophosphohydrolase [Clostridia bacterium]HOM33715.1 bifunctional (p)ppGpp synthetase/guanosine-3',5'-bis(diphosphate) 3'-pyrophosphohydrolase [Clostridia bacterium]HPL07193.1 bifunctional (p)ppGpp synthetase/guanosine-3',5'-bis(diphosphate) 3'-pyrophosphohydrolase [Clostridia bacterium]HQG00313.1 